MSKFPLIEVGTLLIIDSGIQNNSVGTVPLQSALSTLDCSRELVSGLKRLPKQLNLSSLSALVFSRWNPDTRGTTLVSYARQKSSRLPIMVAGLSNSAAVRIRAYESGADHYVSPTCSKREITARINSLLRHSETDDKSICIHDLKVWAASRVAFRSGQPIKFSRKEMEILLYLIEHRYQPVSRSQILKDVFGMSFEPGTNVLEVHIHRLRQKIDLGHERQLLNTVRGSGYILG